MNAIEFVASLNKTSRIEDLAKMEASEYFSTPAGKKVISFLSGKVSVMDEKTFELVDFHVISTLEKDLLYKGRDFLSDMKALGFTFEITSHHQDEAPIKTYLFRG